MITFEWQYTYRSARRDGYRRRHAFGMFIREVFLGWTTPVRYRNEGGRLVRRGAR